LADFREEVLSAVTVLDDYPHAHDVRGGVLVYPAAAIEHADRRQLQAELIRALADGPGVVMFEGAFSDASVDAASAAFRDLINAQRADGTAAGDHFGKPGANDRIWNAAQKLALHAPEVYAEYYANDALAMVSQAWLGPRYQVTSQVNVVNPGGAEQVPHRDYHLGFVAVNQLSAYPAHLHRMSAVLTLQGAVAHCDMPLASGPTMLLPHSQRFAAGYVAFYRPEFVEFFAEHHVQIPLRKGDAVFFNPALYHGAGTNTSTGISRMANLLQVSSPFGRAMESLDRGAMVRAVYPALRAMQAAGRSPQEVLNAVVATAEGYPFPTNLDRDQPIGSLAPLSQVEIVLAALTADSTPAELDAALRGRDERRTP
jgi:ectoine hydroxylase-related dioxygenase (phytanoyl-CoA dioxygenase family)